MDPQPVEQILCPDCLRPLLATARRCPACGARTAAKPLLQDRAWFVLALVFGAALFLGYPLLWRTQAFSRTTKIVLSALVVVETIVVFGLFYLVMRWCYTRITDALS